MHNQCHLKSCLFLEGLKSAANAQLTAFKNQFNSGCLRGAVKMHNQHHLKICSFQNIKRQCKNTQSASFKKLFIFRTFKKHCKMHNQHHSRNILSFRLFKRCCKNAQSKSFKKLIIFGRFKKCCKKAKSAFKNLTVLEYLRGTVKMHIQNHSKNDNFRTFKRYCKNAQKHH